MGANSWGWTILGDDVIRMQQEAAQRVQRMQERARRLVAESPPPIDRPAAGSHQAEKRTAAAVEAARQAQEEHRPPPKETAEPGRPAVPLSAQALADGESDSPSGLAALIGDQDRLFILLLALLLVRNGAKMELVLALLYLAM